MFIFTTQGMNVISNKNNQKATMDASVFHDQSTLQGSHRDSRATR